MSTKSPGKRRLRSGSSLSSKPRPQSASMSRASRSEGQDSENSFAAGDRPYTFGRPRTTSLSGLVIATTKTPTRSFYHRSFHGHLDPAQYSSAGVRDQTAELASFALSDNNSGFGGTSPPEPYSLNEPHNESDSDSGSDDTRPSKIDEVSEPVTPDVSPREPYPIPYISALTQMIKSASPSPPEDEVAVTTSDTGKSQRVTTAAAVTISEETPLLARSGSSRLRRSSEAARDVERQSYTHSASSSLVRSKSHSALSNIRSCGYLFSHPKTWDSRALWAQLILHPLKLLPAVFLGLLLNVLDALSYGMILFPLGQPLFEDLGSDGIAMFYVSTIVSQVIFSAGGSKFKGGIGSEMIEVVPFFHKMAFTILHRVGEQNRKEVLATTVLSFAISSILTGAVFFLMGACRSGSLIGFFPRHILIGCIGGVGWFLVATGVEVSARLPGELEYNLATARQLVQLDTVFLWTIPFFLAVVLLIVQRFVKNNFLVGGYFISVAVVFYFFKFALDIQMDTLHDRGWIFDSPPASNPWWHFYTLYDFRAVHWQALVETVPAMFALTFFGVLHVPINVPALGISTGEDNLNLDRELIAHGLTNCASGFAGSIQNYLVYTNSLLFIDSGGNDRLAGLMLAAATVAILMAGPAIVGYIPIMVVGSLIFLLGIELLKEALVDTWGRLHRLEFLTVLIIVVTMGVWDFVMGILVGIMLAALSFVVQTSRRTAIRATYSGTIANSTVRRPPVQHRFLKDAGQQIFVVKLTGFLFFGTIVSVEARIRALLADDAFRQRPLRYLVLDMAHINGVDFSAAEAFTRINRLLRQRDVTLVISGLGLEDEVSQALHNVGLFKEESQVRIFIDLNEALEDCENKLLSTLYRQVEHRRSRRAPSQLEVPKQEVDSTIYPTEFMINSPRRHQLHEVAATALDENRTQAPKWQSFKQPLPLILSIFEDLSDFNEDFWFRAVRFFEKTNYPAGSILFSKGDEAKGFYLLEEGILRGDYELPQGSYWELIVAGRPFGELPFFSETRRTATMVAEKSSVAWKLSQDRWLEMQEEEREVASELLKVSLKLTKERMDAITSYVLTTAG